MIFYSDITNPKLQKRSITQNEYFNLQTVLFDNAHGLLLFYGYDPAFMDSIIKNHNIEFLEE